MLNSDIRGFAGRQWRSVAHGGCDRQHGGHRSRVLGPRLCPTESARSLHASGELSAVDSAENRQRMLVQSKVGCTNQLLGATLWQSAAVEDQNQF